MSTITIGGRKIGLDQPAYIVAELSANHLGDRSRAEAIIHAAAEAGANAIKLQTYTSDTMTLPIDSPHFVVGEGSPWAGRRLHELYAEAMTPWEWHAPLQKVAHTLGLAFFSSPFDKTAVAFLEELDVPAYKIASFELVDIPLLETIAQTGKPIIMSTGMAQEDEISEAVAFLREHTEAPVALLHCVSAYPAPAASMRLRAIPWLATRFHTIVGLSDHSPGSHVAVAGIAMGASILEKHLTLSRADGGLDAPFSMEPAEFGAMVREIREVEAALAVPPHPHPDGDNSHRALRRSIFASAPIGRGEELTESNIRTIRPGHGLHPRHFREVLGRRARLPIAAGTPLSWDLLE